jgi:hypothetical protein
MLIFLDIDGVMVPAKGWKNPELLEDGFPAFSNKARHVLQNLISEDTTIILTTSHKSKYTIDQWKAIFKKRGITATKIKTLDVNVNSPSRKDEIVNWFNINNTNEDFIIIDDDKSLNSLPSFLKERLLQTSPLIGLTEQHLENARLILNRDFKML